MGIKSNYLISRELHFLVFCNRCFCWYYINQLWRFSELLNYRDRRSICKLLKVIYIKMWEGRARLGVGNVSTYHSLPQSLLSILFLSCLLSLLLRPAGSTGAMTISLPSLHLSNRWLQCLMGYKLQGECFI